MPTSEVLAGETMMLDRDLRKVVDHHTLRWDFALAGGGESGTYIDLRSALLCPQCGARLEQWYRQRIDDWAWVTPVATGSFGALLLGRLAVGGWGCVLWNPKGHGAEWSIGAGHKPVRVVLVDDVLTTGGTLRALREACEAQGWQVVGEIVAVRRD